MTRIPGKAAIFSGIIFALFAFGLSTKISHCDAPLGMENGAIPDDDITASSAFDHQNVGAQHGRIRNELKYGAWCPLSRITSDPTEWIQIDLHQVHLITATETQGRFGNGQGVEFAEHYILEYFRPKLNKWVRYQSKSGSHLLRGNVNPYLEHKTYLDHPIWASKVRLFPHSVFERTVCMRVEIYGCRWSEGVISYAMPQGDRRSPEWEFYDNVYDGLWLGNSLQNGLGQLVDGLTALDDFRSPPAEPAFQNWIGWNNDTAKANSVEIIFEFDRLREFFSVKIHANNQFTRNVQVFRCAKVFFSVDGTKYHHKPIEFEYVEDRIFEVARNVSIRLHHRTGRFVKIQLFFADKWMLLSEVSFESFPTTQDWIQQHENLSIYHETKEHRIERNGVVWMIWTGVAVVLGVVGAFVAVILYLSKISRDTKTRLGVDNQKLRVIVQKNPNIPEYAVPVDVNYSLPKDVLPETSIYEEYATVAP